MKQRRRCSICKSFAGDDGLCSPCREKSRAKQTAPPHIVSDVYYEDRYISIADSQYEDHFGIIKNDYGIMRGYNDGK